MEDKKEKLIQKVAQEVYAKKGKIIDDFLKAYCASRDFKAKDIRRLKLIMRELPPVVENGIVKVGYEYKFELKRGREKSKI